MNDFIGKVVVDIRGMEQDSEFIVFKCDDGTLYEMFHEPDCCESVWLEDVNGDVKKLLNSPILGFDVKEQKDEDARESGTFTFYTIYTAKGRVDLRWHGESNGYYSERVEFKQRK